jgi:hypothetical protein
MVSPEGLEPPTLRSVVLGLDLNSSFQKSWQVSNRLLVIAGLRGHEEW